MDDRSTMKIRGLFRHTSIRISEDFSYIFSSFIFYRELRSNTEKVPIKPSASVITYSFLEEGLKAQERMI